MKRLKFWLSAVILCGFASGAWAEPYFTAMKGVNCNACHVNQDGGYLRNDFGRNYGNSQETFDWEGISDAVNTVKHDTPSWVNVGVDAHMSFTANFNPNSSTNSNYLGSGYDKRAFSIQAHANEYVSAVVDYPAGGSPDMEIYGLVSNLPQGAYVKIGQFLLPYGLTLADDASLIRQNLGFWFAGPDPNAVEVGIYPGPFFINTALAQGDNNEKEISTKGGFNFTDFTLAGSLYAGNLDEINNPDRKVLYNVYGWGRIKPFVILGEFDEGDSGSGISYNRVHAAHVSAEADLGGSIYLRGVTEWATSSTSGFTDTFRHVVSLRCYPVRNFKLQLDLFRVASNKGPLVGDYDGITLDSYVFY